MAKSAQRSITFISEMKINKKREQTEFTVNFWQDNFFKLFLFSTVSFCSVCNRVFLFNTIFIFSSTSTALHCHHIIFSSSRSLTGTDELRFVRITRELRKTVDISYIILTMPLSATRPSLTSIHLFISEPESHNEEQIKPQRDRVITCLWFDDN